ncbi:MAG: hypothetical protein Q8O95_00555 [bacterium]|nr:hypothetical protein [bacterium]
MITSVLHSFYHRLIHLVTRIRGFEESGHIAIDSIALGIREQIQEAGAL